MSTEPELKRGVVHKYDQNTGKLTPEKHSKLPTHRQREEARRQSTSPFYEPQKRIG